MAVSPAGLGTKNHCAGEGMQQFNSQKGLTSQYFIHESGNKLIIAQVNKKYIAF
jgi:hypothetical protein